MFLAKSLIEVEVDHPSGEPFIKYFYIWYHEVIQIDKNGFVGSTSRLKSHLGFTPKK